LGARVVNPSSRDRCGKKNKRKYKKTQGLVRGARGESLLLRQVWGKNKNKLKLKKGQVSCVARAESLLSRQVW
jgi:hypothetical protein